MPQSDDSRHGQCLDYCSPTAEAEQLRVAQRIAGGALYQCSRGSKARARDQGPGDPREPVGADYDLGSGVSATGEEGSEYRGYVQVRAAKCYSSNAASQEGGGEARKNENGLPGYGAPPTSSAMDSTASAMRGPWLRRKMT